MRVRMFALSTLLAVLIFAICSQSRVTAPVVEITDPTAPEALPAQELPGNGSITLGQPLPLLEQNEPPAETTTTTMESQPVVITYSVRRGDTLQSIANRSGKTLGELMRLNGIRNADRIYIGQVLRLGTKNVVSKPVVTHAGPAEPLLPDSEIVYSPAYKNFDIRAVAENSGGYLSSYQEFAEGQIRTGPEIIQLLSEEFSVGPRVLLAVLELKSSWLTKNSPDLNGNPYPMGYKQPGWEGLYRQTFWAAERLNAAYYLSRQNQLTTLSLFDGNKIKLAPRLNPGTVAVQNVIARTGTWETFSEQITNGDFQATYKWLFGAPEKFAVQELVPEDLTQPLFRLPWEDNHTWWLTGGPHNGWAEGSAWAAVDFAPSSDMGSCRVSREWDVAVAPGKIISAENGRVILDLDGDGFQGTGWVLLYMHVAAKDRVAVGTVLNAGDRIGHPSCEGGISTGTHLHLARMYNGQWIRADDPRAPFDLSGWSMEATDTMYDGYAVNGNQRREACGCRDQALNGIEAIPSLRATAAISQLEKPDTANSSALAVDDGAAKPGSKPASKPASNSATSPASNPATGGVLKTNPKPALESER
jgi:LasA protease